MDLPGKQNRKYSEGGLGVTGHKSRREKVGEAEKVQCKEEELEVRGTGVLM